jgi:hypothetical protein
MHRLVIWGFALALIPLTLSAVWELVVLVRATLSGTNTNESTRAPVTRREPSYTERV